MCKRGDWQKQLRDVITQRLKQATLGSGTISSLWSEEPGTILQYKCRTLLPKSRLESLSDFVARGSQR